MEKVYVYHFTKEIIRRRPGSDQHFGNKSKHAHHLANDKRPDCCPGVPLALQKECEEEHSRDRRANISLNALKKQLDLGTD